MLKMNKDGQRWTEMDRQTVVQGQTSGREIDKQMDRQTGRQMDTGRQTDLVSDILPAGAPQSFGADGLPHN